MQNGCGKPSPEAGRQTTVQKRKEIKRIGILSDTHGYYDKRYAEFFSDCDEIWHAGDIGSLELYNALCAIKPVRAVYGNIDGQDLRRILSKSISFRIEEVNVFMTHIGGYPGRYAPGIASTLLKNETGLFVCGHSHILKVMYDKQLNLLHINPGAAGREGFQQVRTMVKVEISGNKFENLQVMEMKLTSKD